MGIESESGTLEAPRRMTPFEAVESGIMPPPGEFGSSTETVDEDKTRVMTAASEAAKRVLEKQDAKVRALSDRAEKLANSGRAKAAEKVLKKADKANSAAWETYRGIEPAVDAAGKRFDRTIKPIGYREDLISNPTPAPKDRSHEERPASELPLSVVRLRKASPAVSLPPSRFRSPPDPSPKPLGLSPKPSEFPEPPSFSSSRPPRRKFPPPPPPRNRP